jgi:hypothetical protein
MAVVFDGSWLSPVGALFSISSEDSSIVPFIVVRKEWMVPRAVLVMNSTPRLLQRLDVLAVVINFDTNYHMWAAFECDVGSMVEKVGPQNDEIAAEERNASVILVAWLNPNTASMEWA